MYEGSVSFLFLSANNPTLLCSIARGLSLLDAPPKSGLQQLKTDQDLHYTKNSCKIIALNIYLYIICLVITLTKEFMRNKLYLP